MAKLQADAVIGDDFESFDVVVGLARHHGVHSAGVVSDHAADGAAGVAGGVGREGEVKFLGGIPKTIEHDPRLHAGDAARGIDLEDSRHVLRKIQHDGDVAALAGKRCTAAAAKQRRTEFAAKGDSRENIVHVMREDDANRNLAIVGTVGGVESTAALIETDFAAQGAAQGLGQP